MKFLKQLVWKIIEKLVPLLLPARIMVNKKLFPIWEKKGFHVTPVDYYEPLPDTRTLKDGLWENKSELIGIDMGETGQLKMLREYSDKFGSEYNQFPKAKTDVPYRYFTGNGAFDSVDGEMLYCMVRNYKPKKIFEIGSGNSTYLSAQAVLKNESEGHKCQLTAFEPYPDETLKKGYPGLSELVTSKIEEIPLQKFSELGENDILFIDSSHVLKIGSDVKYEYLEILPRLKKGVIIHIHDIFLPGEYPKQWIFEKHMFWNEQYLLQAFLTFNDRFKVLWAGQNIHLRHPEELEKAFQTYNRDRVSPGSFWMKKIQ